MSMFAYNANRRTVGALKENLEKLSSGYRINRSADDAAGLAVSERIRAKVTELDRCQRNAAEGIDLARTADAALAEVSDMLKRARSLCIQAENSTYSSQELASISGEMNQLFSEIERIAKGSTFNTIRLFQGQVPGFEPPFHYEYDEVFSPSGDALQIWGNMDFVKDADFDVAEKAKAATAPFKLDDDIDLNDISTLNGRSITITYPYSYGGTASQTFYFTDGSSPTPSGSTAIDLNNYRTFERALAQISVYDYYQGGYIPQTVTLDRATRTVTMTTPLRNLPHTVNGTSFPVAQGNGSWANGKVTAGNPAGSEPLNEVDGGGAANNKPVYSDTVTATLSLARVHQTLTQADITNLNGNRLSIGGQTIYLKDLGVAAGQTRNDLGSALVAKINALGSNYEASYDNGTSTLSVKLKNRPTGSASSLTISEYVTSGTDPTYKPNEYDTASAWSSAALGLHVTQTQTSTPERPEKYEITIPDSPGVPFSFSAYGYDYLYYDSDKNKLTNGDYNLTSYSTTPNFKKDTKGMTQEQIVADVANAIKARIGSQGEVTIAGNKLTVTGTHINSNLNLGSQIKGTTIRVTPYKRGDLISPGTPGTSQVLNPNGYYDHYSQEVHVPFALTSEADIPNLAGSGFSVSGRKFEFVNGAGTGKSGDYNDIDISGCTTYEQLRDKVQAVMGSSYTIKINQAAGAANATLEIWMTHTDSSSTITVTDGYAGVKGLIAGGGSVVFSGGTDTGHSQKAIDFSSIQTKQDLEALLGKGFRINCATCSGEYINVFFCWKKSGDIPLTFERLDPDTGEIRTIHNIPVELSKISNGRSIVRSIVDQVAPTLKHYTDVAVGDSPTTLLAQDKRRGDVKDAAGKLYLGKVLSGVEANFSYSVGFRKVLDNPEDADEVVIQDSEVKIYVGSDPKAQFIPVHLPHLDLETLKLGRRAA